MQEPFNHLNKMYERIDQTRLELPTTSTKKEKKNLYFQTLIYLHKPTFQYFGSSLESRELLSADVRGTFENSESEVSDCRKFPLETVRLGFEFNGGLNLEKPEAEAAPTWLDTGEEEDPVKF